MTVTIKVPLEGISHGPSGYIGNGCPYVGRRTNQVIVLIQHIHVQDDVFCQLVILSTRTCRILIGNLSQIGQFGTI